MDENSSGSFTGFDFASADDKCFAFDYNHSGKMDHLVLYRPGAGIFVVVKNDGAGKMVTVFTSVGGVAGFDLMNKVDLHREVFGIDAVLAWGMEMELSQGKLLLTKGDGAIGNDLEGSSQVGDLGSLRRVGESLLECSTGDNLRVGRVNVDGRLSCAYGTVQVGRSQTMPVERTLKILEKNGGIFIKLGQHLVCFYHGPASPREKGQS